MSTSPEVAALYKQVVEDVIKRVRGDIINMGVDEQVMVDLQTLWEQKLLETQVLNGVEYPFAGSREVGATGFGHGHGHGHAAPSAAGYFYPVSMPGGTSHPHSSMIMSGSGSSVGQQRMPNDSSTNGAANSLELLGATAIANTSPFQPHPYMRPYFPGPQSTSAANLPTLSGQGMAAQYVQPQYRPAADGHQSPSHTDSHAAQTEQKGPPQLDGSAEAAASADDIAHHPAIQSRLPIPQVDGDNASYEDASARYDSDAINSDLDDDDSDNDNEAEASASDNIILCQYEKVQRTKNKWRCNFRAGVLHLDGVDYAFQRASGDFEW